MEINPCVLQDIGPLGPLPKKQSQRKGTVESWTERGETIESTLEEIGTNGQEPKERSYSVVYIVDEIDGSSPNV